MKQEKKVLIIDDETNIIFSLELLLKAESYIVETASHGLEGLKLYKSFKPDIVLLDIMMPEMDGFETAIKIRELDIESKTSIIFLTAKGTSTDKVNAYAKGGDDYIVKPFDNNHLLEKLKNA